MATLYAGTSGFAYPAWKPAFYPAKLPAGKFLNHYATRLNCVEINYTFRRLPAPGTLQKWVEATPAGYREKGRFTPSGAPERGQAKAWPHPVVANGRLYVRDLGTLWSYDVRR